MDIHFLLFMLFIYDSILIQKEITIDQAKLIIHNKNQFKNMPVISNNLSIILEDTTTNSFVGYYFLSKIKNHEISLYAEEFNENIRIKESEYCTPSEACFWVYLFISISKFN